MEGIRHAIETAIRHDKLAGIYRRIVVTRTEDHLKTLNSKVDKLNYVGKVFEGFSSGAEISAAYNLRQKINKGEI